MPDIVPSFLKKTFNSNTVKTLALFTLLTLGFSSCKDANEEFLKIQADTEIGKIAAGETSGITSSMNGKSYYTMPAKIKLDDLWYLACNDCSAAFVKTKRQDLTPVARDEILPDDVQTYVNNLRRRTTTVSDYLIFNVTDTTNKKISVSYYKEGTLGGDGDVSFNFSRSFVHLKE